MNAICGLLARDQSSIDADALQSMADMLPAMPGARRSQYHDGAIGFARGIGMFTPEDKYDRGMMALRGERVTFCGIATLYNRDALINALGLAPSMAATQSDAGLMGHAYERWGEQVTNQLEGSWAFAAWDHVQRQLTLVRDHSSHMELFYHLSTKHFAFAFRPRALMALPFVPKALNLDRIGQTLMVLRDDATSTVWHGIESLARAHLLRVDADRCVVAQYWWPERSARVRFATDDAYLEAFREVFDRSVRGTLRSPDPIAVTLSGGLDSALVMESSVRQGNRAHGNFQAYTSVPAFNIAGLEPQSQFGDEGGPAASVARLLGHIDHHLVDATDTSPIAGIARIVSASDTLDYAVGNCYWLSSMLDAVAAAGSSALLMGAGGNATVSWDGGSYVANVTSWPPTRAALALWRERNGGSTAQALRSLVLAPLMPRRARWWRGRAATSRYTSWQGYSAMNPAWFAEHNFADKVAQSGRSMLFERPFHRSTRDEQLMTLRPDRRQGGGFWWHMMLASGVQPRDPTKDPRLIEFCLGLPSHQYQRDSVNRFLARRALDGRVPDAVAWNQRRGLQGADLLLRIRANAAEVQETLTRIEASPLARQMLDVPRMRQVLQSAEEGQSAAIGRDCELVLMRGIGAGLFITGADA